MGQQAFEAAEQELSTILDVIRWGMSQFNQAGCFYGHGTDNAWDEALQLTLHALHLGLNCKKDILQAKLTQSERREVLDLFKQRIEKRLPAAYLTHKAYFADLEFFVDERVLVPRSPLAELIEQQFEPWVVADQVDHILDLCTGSGCIAIACAAYFPDAQVDAIDISKDALTVAQINKDKYDFAENVTLIESDLLAEVTGKQYDVIISNPPYVDVDDMTSMPKEFNHEPRLGLESGQDGLDCARQILQQAANHLTENGILICEVGNSADALVEAYPNVPFAWLEFERGGDGVFLLTKQQLQAIT